MPAGGAVLGTLTPTIGSALLRSHGEPSTLRSNSTSQSLTSASRLSARPASTHRVVPCPRRLRLGLLKRGQRSSLVATSFYFNSTGIFACRHSHHLQSRRRNPSSEAFACSSLSVRACSMRDECCSRALHQPCQHVAVLWHCSPQAFSICYLMVLPFEVCSWTNSYGPPALADRIDPLTRLTIAASPSDLTI